LAGAGWGGAGAWGYNPGYVYPATVDNNVDATSTATDVNITNLTGTDGANAYADNNSAGTASNGDRAFNTLPNAQGENANAAQADPVEPTDEQMEDAAQLTAQGEADFKAGKYQRAIRHWRHALLDDPHDGAVVLMLSQALFAVGEFNQSAGAVQVALPMLPEEDWGAVVAERGELYGNGKDYSEQLKALEQAAQAQPKSPALQFLLGYHYAFQNQPQRAVAQLDKVLEQAPKDEVARRLRDLTAEKLAGGAKKAPANRNPLDIIIETPSN